MKYNNLPHLVDGRTSFPEEPVKLAWRGQSSGEMIKSLSLILITITSHFLLRAPAGWARDQASLEPAQGRRGGAE